MKLRILLYTCLSCMSSVCAMDQGDRQNFPAPVQQIPATAAAVAAQAAQREAASVIHPSTVHSSPATAVAVAVEQQKQQNGSTVVFSLQALHTPEHRIHASAVQFSRILQKMLEVSHHSSGQLYTSPLNDDKTVNPFYGHTTGSIGFHFADSHLRFVVDLLNFIAHQVQENNQLPTNQHIMDFISDRTQSFTAISFTDVLRSINFFDIPVALNAITDIPVLPLPKNSAQEILYNNQLAAVFVLTKETRDRRLWQLFGRMLYPRCFRYKKIAEMLAFVKSMKEIEQAVLGGYMQQHPELYSQVLQEIQASHYALVAYNQDRTKIVSGDREGVVKVWDVATARFLHRFASHEKHIKSLSFSPHGEIVAAISGSDTMQLWDIKSGKQMQIFHIPSSMHDHEFISAFSFSPDNNTIVLGFSDGDIQVIDIKTGALLHRFAGHTKTVFSVLFSHDGKKIISGSKDGTLRIWDTAVVKENRVIKGGKPGSFSISLSPDGRTMCSTGLADHSIRIIDIQTGDVLYRLRGHAKYVFCLAYSPDGRTIASGSTDRTIRLWNAQTGALLHTIVDADCPSEITSISFSPDGRTIVSGSGADRVQLWNVSSGEKIDGPLELSIMVFSVDFSLDGRTIITRDINGLIEIWGSESLQDALQEPLEGMQEDGETSSSYSRSYSTDTGSWSSATDTSDREDDPVILPAPLPEK